MSQVYKHLYENENCVFKAITMNVFCILDTASTKYQHKLKEGSYIELEKPELNRQIKHLLNSKV